MQDRYIITVSNPIKGYRLSSDPLTIQEALRCFSLTLKMSVDYCGEATYPQSMKELIDVLNHISRKHTSPKKCNQYTYHTI
jgi:hypothetical protein